MRKFKLVTICFITLLSNLSQAGKDGISPIEVGSKEMYKLFESKGVEYISGVEFVETLNMDGFPGVYLSFEKDSLPNKEFEDSYTTYSWKHVVKIKDKLKTYIKHVKQIDGLGLFAGQDIKKDTIIGVYAGEIILPLDTNNSSKVFLSDELNKKHSLHSMNSEERAKFISSNKNLFSGSLGTIGNVGEFASRYLFSMPFHKTAMVCVDAHRVGNEMRFINHTSNENYRNCQAITVSMNYYDLLVLSGHIEESETIKKNLKDILISVPVYITTKKVKKDQQFLANYGNMYFEKLKIKPVELKP